MSESFSSGLVPIPADTRRTLLAKILLALNDLGGGGGGGIAAAQLKQYEVDPAGEGVVPADLNAPAFAYQKDGAGSIFTWNTTSHTWQ